MPWDALKLQAMDSTSQWWSDPYRFIQRKCGEKGVDAFQTRMFLQKTICMTGAPAAELFYESERLTRIGAMPEPVLATLFGKGGVQGLDGEEHHYRKKLFTSILMNTGEIRRLREISAAWWSFYADKWSGEEKVCLYHGVQEVLTASVCEWAGVPLSKEEIAPRSRELAALFDQAGSFGPGHLWSRWSRKISEMWIEEVIKHLRQNPGSGSVAEAVAQHYDMYGNRLHSRIAAVELLNILRPTVAVSVYVVFLAHALFRYPEIREKMEYEKDYGDLVVQEVRRFYPFVPAMAALVRRDFTWRDIQFYQGTRVLFDFFGTHRDPRLWDSPDTFHPERFRNRQEIPFAFIPQGGGSFEDNHRCPGDWATVELMKEALNFLAFRLDYFVPDQNLELEWSRLPAIPHSRFMISDVRLRSTGSAAVSF